jgi:uncharacterized protein YicC (UPF0701 family)
MLRSMTGYGKSEGAVGSRKYTVEVRSLNGKNLDMTVRMPSVLKEKEMDLSSGEESAMWPSILKRMPQR